MKIRLGPSLARLIQAEGWSVTKETILPDDESAIRKTLIEWADSDKFDVILTTGGTGFSPRDVTPEATRAVIDREAPGLAEAMRARKPQDHAACHAFKNCYWDSEKNVNYQFTRQP